MLRILLNFFIKKSGQQDLNLRPLGPQPSALPSYAIPRNISIILEMPILVKKNICISCQVSCQIPSA